MKFLKVLAGILILITGLWSCEGVFTTTSGEPGVEIEIKFNLAALQSAREIIITDSLVIPELDYLWLQIKDAKFRELYSKRLTKEDLASSIKILLDQSVIILNVEVGWLIDDTLQIENTSRTIYLTGYHKIIIDIIPPSGLIVGVNEPEKSDEAITMGVYDGFSYSLREIFNSHDFQTRFPGINIVMEDLTWGEHYASLETQLAGGIDARDIVLIDAKHLQQFTTGDILTDLAGEPYNGLAASVDLVPHAVAASTTTSGKLLGLPLHTAPTVLFWRKSLLDEAELDFSEIADWDEFIAAGKKLTIDKDGDRNPDQWAFTHVKNMYLLLLNGGKGDWFSGGEPYEPQERFLYTLRVARDLRLAGIDGEFYNWSDEWQAAIKEGKIAAFFYEAGMGNSMKTWFCPELSGDWRVSVPPAKTYASQSDKYFIIPGKTTPEKKRIAWEIINYLCTSPEAQLTMYRIRGDFPALTTVYNDPVMDEPDSYFGNQQVAHIYREISLGVPVMYPGENDPIASGCFYAAVNKVINQGIPVEQAYAEAKQAVRDLM